MSSTPDNELIVKEKNIHLVLFAFLVDRRWWIVPILLGLLVVGWSFAQSVSSIRQQSFEVASESARNMFRMVKLTRLWNAQHGGIYVPLSDYVKPNPYLSVPHRDIETTNGKKLTLVNPAFMTRQLSELAISNPQYPVLFHITSLKPIRPQNIADDWEAVALKRFENEDIEEITGRLSYHGRDTFRFMGALITESPCLKCHEEQGYKLGDIRGGISVTLESEDYFGGDDKLINQSLVQHLVAYLFFVVLLWVLLEQIRRQWLLLSEAEQSQKKIIAERTQELQLTNEKLLLENQERKAAEERYLAIHESVFDAIVSTDSAGFVLSWNAAAEKLFGYAPDEIIGHNVTKIMPKRFQQKHKRGMSQVSMGETPSLIKPMEVAGRHRDGHEIPVEISLGHRMHDDHIIYSAIIRDISVYKEMRDQIRDNESEILRLAHYDSLTNLPNRDLFTAQLQQAMQLASGYQKQLAVMHIDLDEFKKINDSLGHNVGDRLLEKMAQTIRDIASDQDTLGRLGSDEFVLLLDHINDSADAASIAQALIDRLEMPFEMDGHEIYQSVSIGIGLYPRDGDDADIMLRNIESAMFRAKEKGRNRFMFYAEEMTEQAYDYVFMEARLRKAIDDDEFVPYFQPQIDAETNRISGVEALVRWIHQGEVISADLFIPLAEQTGLIERLGMNILRKSCRQMFQWQQQGLIDQEMKVSVNLSARQLENPNLVEDILKEVQDSELPKNRLELEITESLIMSDPDHAITVFDQIRSHGIELTIDDFGTGYSSLGYIKNLPVGKLKIDRSFVQDLPDNEDDVVIARSIIAMAKSLKLGVVAEGVENTGQLNLLTSEGCNIIQGYFFSRPLPADEFLAFYKDFTAQANSA